MCDVLVRNLCDAQKVQNLCVARKKSSNKKCENALISKKKAKKMQEKAKKCKCKKKNANMKER